MSVDPEDASHEAEDGPSSLPHIEAADVRERRRRLRELVKLARLPESVLAPLANMAPEQLDLLFQHTPNVTALSGVDPAVFDRLVALDPATLERVVRDGRDIIVFAGVRPDAFERILEVYSGAASDTDVQQFQRLNRLIGQLSGAKSELLARVDRDRLPELLFRELEWTTRRRSSLAKWLIAGIIVGLVTLAAHPWIRGQVWP